MKQLQTAHYFWNAFFSYTQSNTVSGEEHSEGLRHRCLLGFTAIDASLCFYWKQIVVPEWSEFQSLINEVINQPDLRNLVGETTSTHFNRAQWMASLRFIQNTGDPENFSPTFVDAAIALAINGPDTPSQELELLWHLQKARNCAIHTGREWTKLQGYQAIAKIEEFYKSALNIHPIFSELFVDYKTEDSLAA
jgi:hypothetical protein